MSDQRTFQLVIEHCENDYRSRCSLTVILLVKLGEGMLPLRFFDDRGTALCLGRTYQANENFDTQVNTCMRIEQLSQILDQGKTDKATVSNADRMSNAIRKVLNEDARLMSEGKEAYEEARRKDFEMKRQEDMRSNRKMTFTEMVNRYL